MSRLPATPPGHVIYAVGDLHGRADLLDRLLSQIEADAQTPARRAKKKSLVFLGDYVDRGLDSRGVIARLCSPFSAGLSPVFLRGNHDSMVLQFIGGDLRIATAWMHYGGAATLASYGLNPFGASAPEKIPALHDSFLKALPESHRVFFERTELSATFGDYFFVHAGARPGVPLAQQSHEDLMWIRQDFLESSAGFGKMIVHGHTIQTQPVVRANRIGIDTGAFATGRLTCLVLENQDRRFLST